MSPLQKHYLALLWNQKGFAFLGIFFAIITAFAGIALLAVAGWFISAAGLAGLAAATAMAFNFFTPGAIVRGLSMARTAGRYAERLTSHEATFRIISRLRADIFKLLASRFWYEQPFNRHQTGSRLLQDIQHIESIYLSAVSPGIVVLSVTIGYLSVLGYFLPNAMAFALPLVLSVVLLMPLLYSRLVLSPQDDLHTLRSSQWQTASSLLSNFRTLVLHGRINKTTDDLMVQANQADQLEVRAVNRQLWITLLTQLQLVALIVLVFKAGLTAASNDMLEPANAFMLLLLSLGSAEVLVTACPVLASLQLGLRSLKRLEVMSEAAEGQQQDTRDLQRADSPTIKLNQITYAYPQAEPVFNELNHELSGPSWYWVTGPSGSGKSTLIALLAGQVQPESGQIEIQSPHSQRPALMPQRIDILRASVRDNLCLHHEHSDEAILQVLVDVELNEWVSKLPHGLDTWIGDGEWQPSGGEAKRIGLARVALQDSDIILLDEPSAGMDHDLAERVFQNLATRWQQKLVIANTHQPSLQKSGQQRLKLAE